MLGTGAHIVRQGGAFDRIHPPSDRHAADTVGRAEDVSAQGRQPDPAPVCTARIPSEYRDGLRSLEGFSHLILLYWLDQVTQPRLIFTPPFDSQPRGIFSTRGPRALDPIGVSVVLFEGVDGAGDLIVRYLDCVDGTPLLDIKPYLPTTDCEPAPQWDGLTRMRRGTGKRGR